MTRFLYRRQMVVAVSRNILAWATIASVLALASSCATKTPVGQQQSAPGPVNSPATITSQVDSVQAEWFPTEPITIISGDFDAVHPVILQTKSGAMLVAAESRLSRSVLLSRSDDGGASWQPPVEIARAAARGLGSWTTKPNTGVVKVTDAVVPGPNDGEKYLDVHRIGTGTRPFIRANFAAPVTGTDVLEFRFAMALQSHLGDPPPESRVGLHFILKSDTGDRLANITASMTGKTWTLANGDWSQSTTTELPNPRHNTWHDVTLRYAADGSVYAVEVDGIAATASFTGHAGALDILEFQTNGENPFHIDAAIMDPGMALIRGVNITTGETIFEHDGFEDDAAGSVPAGPNQLSVGAGGTLSSGRVVLAMQEWNEKPGTVTWTEEAPPGVHHYSWTGFLRTSELHVLVSDDDGKTWTPAACEMSGGPVAPAAMGRVFADQGAWWFAVYGPADAKEMDAALSGVGLMRSDDEGQSWCFSHWAVRADLQQKITYGPGEITVLPDGRWLGMLQANYRGRGDYTRPRISRTISTDAGQTWATPVATLLGPKPSLALLANGQMMVGTRQDRGIIFNLMLNDGADMLYQEHLWETIWYLEGERGGLNLLKLDDDSILAAYHWMDERDLSRCEIRGQIVRQRNEYRVDLPNDVPATGTRSRWVMAEAYQIPDIPDSPSGFLVNTVLKLQSGDWMAIGMTQTILGSGAHGFSNSGFVALRAPALQGPWKKVGDLTPLADVVGDATGSNMPRQMTQTRSGRLLLPVTHGAWDSPDRDMQVLCSDDEGATWRSLTFLGRQIGMSLLSSAARIEQLADGQLLWIAQVGREGWNAAKGDLFYVVSADDGATWTSPTCFAKSQEHPYAGLAGMAGGRDGWIRTPEGQLVKTANGRWLGLYREERGTLVPGGRPGGPVCMAHLMLTRSEDGLRWTSGFGFLGVEPDMAVLPDGTVLVAYREDSLATAWLSYNDGRTWQLQTDPAEVPWRTGAVETHGQWPPGGCALIRVLDENTAVVICESGLLPVGKQLPPGFQGRKELHGRAHVRFFRRRIQPRSRGKDRVD